jgi:hypothetical protein
MTVTNPDPRPEDSFARRFALEQAVAFQSARVANGYKIDSTHVIYVANAFLAFLKGGVQ